MISVGIVGGTGYTGVELLRILLRHPDVTVTTLTSRTEAGKPIANLFPSLRGQTELTFSDLDIEELKQCDVVFFATPHGVAMKHAEALVAANTKVIDLAADFRIQNLDVFEKWYGLKHTCPELLQQSVYGLSELRREQIKHASVVGNPGCYPTTVQLGLAPLLQQAGLIVPERILIDAKSGVSGAGRKAELSLVYSENADNFKAYGVAGHRHHPEIVEALGVIAADTTASFDNIIFVPHLVPMIRGMLSTIYVDLTDKGAALDIQALYEMFYADEYFVDVMPQGSVPDTRSVRGSNMLRMSLTKIQPNKLVIVVVQDNLVKGAAGQAVQNMNIMCGLSENLGLTGIALLP